MRDLKIGDLLKIKPGVTVSNVWELQRGKGQQFSDCYPKDHPSPLACSLLDDNDLYSVSYLQPDFGFDLHANKTFPSRLVLTPIPADAHLEVVGLSIGRKGYAVIDVKLPWHTEESPAYGRGAEGEFIELSSLELLAREAE
mgnify:CR=1 FL=1